MNKYFSDVKKNFGFGCMRLPMIGENVDLEQFKQMIDHFMENGFNYFDTAKVYLKGQSETALRECLVKRYPRESFIFTNKLSSSCFSKHDEIRPLFETQLKDCGLEYFDFYLMHAQNKDRYATYKKEGAFETAYQLKKEGKIRHVGMSFHDTAEVLDMILTEQPELEVVQIQLNYLDYYDKNVQSRACYDVCVKHNKPVIIMEPVKGGSLAELPNSARPYLDALHGGSYASYALRFAAGHENVMMVLSGMSNMAQMEDNTSFMKDFQPLNDIERKALDDVVKAYDDLHLVPCTRCRYCVDGCPMKIQIPNLFYNYNLYKQYERIDAEKYQKATEGFGVASQCLKCGKCERICPQNLPIRKLLEEVKEVFE